MKAYRHEMSSAPDEDGGLVVVYSNNDRQTIFNDLVFFVIINCDDGRTSCSIYQLLTTCFTFWYYVYDFNGAFPSSFVVQLIRTDGTIHRLCCWTHREWSPSFEWRIIYLSYLATSAPSTTQAVIREGSTVVRKKHAWVTQSCNWDGVKAIGHFVCDWEDIYMARRCIWGISEGTENCFEVIAE